MKRAEAPRIIAIVVNWNNYEATKRCIASIKTIRYPNLQTVLVDNGSTNDSSLKIASEYSHIHLLKASENRGYAAGINLGAEFAVESKAEYLLLLNNDVEVINPDFLQNLLDEMRMDHSVGVIGPLVRLMEGSIQPTIGYFPTLKNSIIHGVLGRPAYSQEERSYPESLSGVCLLVRRQAVLDAGWLDENLFMYVEEHEWLYRIRQAGWKIAYIPVESIKHHHGLSAKKISKQAYLLKRTNYIYFLTKHGYPGHAFVTAALYLIYHLLRSLLPSKEQFPSFYEFWTEMLIKWRLGRSRRKNS